jgi:hypothetical protein
VLAIAAITIAHLDEPAGWLVPLHSALQPIKTYCSLLMAIVVGTTIVFVLGIVLAWTIGGKSARRAAAKSV